MASRKGRSRLPAGGSSKARSYAHYLKVPELLDLQRLLSDPPEHDETLFIIIHQVYELWFKQILHELDAILDALARNDVRLATRLFRRVIEIQRVLVTQISVLETMSPSDFLRFRDHLNPASGFQSYQFRELEFVAGLKDPRYLAFYEAEPDLAAGLKARLDAPSLGDAWEALLRRHGFDYPEISSPSSGEERERLGMRRRETLLSIYGDRDAHHDLHALAEVMIEFDENLSLWRWHHVRMVERMIGMKQGTGGSEGVAYLEGTLGKKCFPDLWELRSYLGPADLAG
jgi:tryptophan 2,3-dioxygenase